MEARNETLFMRGVLSKVAERVANTEGTVSLIEIRQATPEQWPVRIYTREEDDFDGFLISSEDLPSVE